MKSNRLFSIMSHPVDISSLRDLILCKITNSDEIHNGHYYVDGINILKGRFSLHGSCVPGGLYFTTIDKIISYLTYGINLRIISLTEVADLDNFTIVSDDEKYRSNMLFLGAKMELSDPDTYEFLVKNGLDLRLNVRGILNHAIKHSYLEVIKYLRVKFGEVAMDHFIESFSYEIIHNVIRKGRDHIYDYFMETYPSLKKQVLTAGIISKKNATLVKRLISEGVEIDEEYMDILIRTLKYGNLELFEFFRDNETPNSKAYYKSEMGIRYVDFEKVKEPIKPIKPIKPDPIEDARERLQTIKDNVIKLIIFYYIHDHQMLGELMRRNTPKIFEYIQIDFDRIDSATKNYFLDCAIRTRNHSMVDFLLTKYTNPKTLSVWRGEGSDITNTFLTSAIGIRYSVETLNLIKKLLPITGDITMILHGKEINVLAYAFRYYNYYLIDYLMEFYADRPAYLELVLEHAIEAFDLNYIEKLLGLGVKFAGSEQNICKAILINPVATFDQFSSYEGILVPERIIVYRESFDMGMRANSERIIDFLEEATIRAKTKSQKS